MIFFPIFKIYIKYDINTTNNGILRTWYIIFFVLNVVFIYFILWDIKIHKSDIENISKKETIYEPLCQCLWPTII